jgi:hypothetical protein
MIPAFMIDSPCSQIDPEVFFPAPKDDQAIADAKRLCGLCRHREACLEWAIAPGSRVADGIAGGLSEDERRELIRQRRIGRAQTYNVGPIPPKNRRFTAVA